MRPDQSVDMSAASVIAVVLMLFGLTLHTYTEFVQATSFSSGFWLLSLGPYICAAIILFLLRRPYVAAGALVLPALLDAGAYYSALIHPQSSSAGLGLLFVPIWNLLLFAPLGGVLGWLVGRRSARRNHMSPDSPPERMHER